MHGDMLRNRIQKLLLLSAVALVALAGRMLYLRGNMAALAQSAGFELEVFYQPADQAPVVNTGVGNGRVRVPALAGTSFTEAGDRLREAGLLLEGTGDLRGRVVRQVPAPGRLVDRWTPVRVYLEPAPAQ